MDHDRGEGLLSDNAICPVVLSWSCCRTLIASGSRRAFSIAALAPQRWTASGRPMPSLDECGPLMKKLSGDHRFLQILQEAPSMTARGSVGMLAVNGNIRHVRMLAIEDKPSRV
jgi:hypothetical protein